MGTCKLHHKSNRSICSCWYITTGNLKVYEGIVFFVVLYCCNLYAVYYNYIHETNHVYFVYHAAVVLCLKFVINVMLFPMINIWHFYISIFQCICTVSNMAVSVVP